jgi:hypothetical protein
MHWFGNSVAAVVLGVAWSLYGLPPRLSVAMAADSPATPVKGGEGNQKSGQPADWGERLKVPQTGAPRGASKDDAVSGSPSNAVSGVKPQGTPPLAIPLVAGYDSFGLNLPDHDPEGRLRSLFVIGAISRLDDRNVEMRESFLETYAADGSPEFSIELPKATLDRFTRVLIAKTPVTLRKVDFELKGASLEFNTVTKEGGLGGPVQMTIYNSSDGAPKSPAPPTPPVPAPR